MKLQNRFGITAVVFALFYLLSPVARAGDLHTLDLPSLELPPYMDALLGNPATQASTQPLIPPETAAERSIAEFIGHFSGYEPMYIIGGPTNPLAKFQFSFKYQILNKDSPLAQSVPVLGGINFAYTQLDRWALNKKDAPITDSNYKPEVFYSNEDIKQIHIPGVSEFGLQTGYGHESNGLGTSVRERAINYLFFRPIFDFGDPERFHFLIAPKAYVYIYSVSDNPDIAKYRGYCDLRATVGWRQGLELSALGRLGSDYNRGSIQMDMTYPIRDLLDNNLDLYLDAQYFYGYGETLYIYNRRTQSFRIGIALVR